MFENQITKKKLDEATKRIEQLERYDREKDQEFARKISNIEAENLREVKDLKSEQARKELDFKKEAEYIKKDTENKSATTIKELEVQVAVLTEANKHLEKMTDINADIIDVKEVMNKLIEKLPEINLTSLTVQNSSK